MMHGGKTPNKQKNEVEMEFDLADEATNAQDVQANMNQVVRITCDFCGRGFDPDASLRHIPICQKNFEKKHGPMRKSALLPTQKKRL